MLARNEVIMKWILYAAATALCLLIQGAVLQRVVIWGVIPFLYPMLAAIPATFEAPVPATVYAGDERWHRPIDTGMAVGGYRIFSSSGFLGALTRDCIERDK